MPATHTRGKAVTNHSGKPALKTLQHNLTQEDVAEVAEPDPVLQSISSAAPGASAGTPQHPEPPPALGIAVSESPETELLAQKCEGPGQGTRTKDLFWPELLQELFAEVGGGREPQDTHGVTCEPRLLQGCA